MNSRDGSFEFASGSVQGRNHRTAGKNSQDSYIVALGENCTVGVVTDGCGSGMQSEVGAQIGARIIAEAMMREVGAGRPLGEIRYQRVQRETEAILTMLARSIGGTFSSVVSNFFLFTVVGFVQSAKELVFFALGDGVIVANGQEIFNPQYSNNEPPYLGYSMLWSGLGSPPPVLSEVNLYRASDVDSFLVASDGVSDIIKVHNRLLPGMEEPVGDMAQFWERDIFFGNPDALRRRLTLMVRDWPKDSPEPGLLSDDTTIIAGRRLIRSTEEGVRTK